MDKKYYYCYKITLTQEKHELFNHYYIGARISPKEPEKDGYRGSSTIINKSKYWDLYPLDYQKTIIKIFDNQEDLYNYEYQLIDEKRKNDPLCLNKFRGGLGGRQYWKKTDKELQEINHKISEKRKGQPHIIKPPAITREKLSRINKGKKLSTEWRQKISKAKMGKRIPKENYKDYEKFCENISKANRGKKLTESQKQQLSIRVKEYFNDPENRKKTSESVKRAMQLPENRQKCILGGKCTKGKIFINKDNINKRINPNELDNYINLGWKKGRFVSWKTKK